VLVTHEHELATPADRQISLRDGRVVSDSDATDSSTLGEQAEDAVEARR
jgi:ABC-type lipoprotein export system ATPase subunit